MKRGLIVGLELIAVIAVTVATFMPMKAILVLASGTVPAFFPVPLVEGGPFAAAAVLLVLSGAAGLAAAGLGTFVTREKSILAAQEPDDSAFLPTDVRRGAGRGRRHTSPPAEVLVMIVFGCGLAWLSPFFLIFTVAWLAVALLWTRLRQARDSTDDDPEQRTLDWARSYRKAVQRSMLPATIVIALTSLLVSTPRLGATGALLAIVLGRRIQIAAASVAEYTLTNLVHGKIDVHSGDESDSDSHASGAIIESISGSIKGKTFREHAKELGLPLSSFSVVSGYAGRQSITLVSAEADAQTSGYLRLYKLGAVHLRLLEYRFRTNSSPVSLFPAEECRMVDVVGLPGLWVSTRVRVIPDAVPTHDEISTWYAGLADRCVQSQPFQEWAAKRVREFPERELDRRLTMATAIPGSTGRHLSELRIVMEEVNSLLRLRPACWVQPGNSGASAFVMLEDSQLALIAPLGWTVGRIGDRQHRNGAVASEVEPSETSHDSESDSTVVKLASRRARLLRELRVSDMRAAEITAKQVMRLREIVDQHR